MKYSAEELATEVEIAVHRMAIVGVEPELTEKFDKVVHELRTLSDLRSFLGRPDFDYVHESDVLYKMSDDQY